MKKSSFQIGDIVETIDDAVEGKIVKIQGEDITIEDSFGFYFQFLAIELMKIPEKHSLLSDIEYDDIEKVKTTELNVDKKLKIRKKPKSLKPTVLEVDLHIHNLTDSTKGLSNFDMLNIQLDTAKRRLENAIRNRVPKIVLIHGVGEGVLKMELHTLLRRYEEVTFYDADFKTYGYGATEVKIFQNT